MDQLDELPDVELADGNRASAGDLSISPADGRRLVNDANSQVSVQR